MSTTRFGRAMATALFCGILVGAQGVTAAQEPSPTATATPEATSPEPEAPASGTPTSDGTPAPSPAPEPSATQEPTAAPAPATEPDAAPSAGEAAATSSSSGGTDTAVHVGSTDVVVPQLCGTTVDSPFCVTVATLLEAAAEIAEGCTDGVDTGATCDEMRRSAAELTLRARAAVAACLEESNATCAYAFELARQLRDVAVTCVTDVVNVEPWTRSAGLDCGAVLAAANELLSAIVTLTTECVAESNPTCAQAMTLVQYAVAATLACAAASATEAGVPVQTGGTSPVDCGVLTRAAIDTTVAAVTLVLACASEQVPACKTALDAGRAGVAALVGCADGAVEEADLVGSLAIETNDSLACQATGALAREAIQGVVTLTLACIDRSNPTCAAALAAADAAVGIGTSCVASVLASQGVTTQFAPDLFCAGVVDTVNAVVARAAAFARDCPQRDHPTCETAFATIDMAVDLASRCAAQEQVTLSTTVGASTLDCGAALRTARELVVFLRLVVERCVTETEPLCATALETARAVAAFALNCVGSATAAAGVVVATATTVDCGAAVRDAITTLAALRAIVYACLQYGEGTCLGLPYALGAVIVETIRCVEGTAGADGAACVGLLTSISRSVGRMVDDVNRCATGVIEPCGTVLRTLDDALRYLTGCARAVLESQNLDLVHFPADDALGCGGVIPWELVDAVERFVDECAQGTAPPCATARRVVAELLCGLGLAAGCPSPVPTVSPTVSPLPTASVTPLPTVSPVPTVSPTPLPTVSPVPTVTVPPTGIGLGSTAVEVEDDGPAGTLTDAAIGPDYLDMDTLPDAPDAVGAELPPRQAPESGSFPEPPTTPSEVESEVVLGEPLLDDAAGDAAIDGVSDGSSETTTTPSSTVVRKFQGPMDGKPPDPHIAAGPTSLITVVNFSLARYSKSGTLLKRASWTDWYAAQGSSGLLFVDPTITFDRVSQRFFILGAGFDSTRHYFFLSVSDDSSGRTWCRYRINTDRRADGTYKNHGFGDFPRLGVSYSGVWMTGNFEDKQTILYTVSKSQVASCRGISGVGIRERMTNVNGSQADTVHPVFTQDTTTTSEYMVNSKLDGANYLTFWRGTCVNSCASAPSLTKISVGVPAYTAPPDLPQSGTGTGANYREPPDINSDARVISAIYKNGRVYLTQIIGRSTHPYPIARLTEISTANKTATTANFTSGTGGYWMPAVAVDSNGTKTIVAEYSNPSIYPGVVFNRYYGGRWHGFRTLYSGSWPINRLGDYGGASVDPDGVTTWVFHEYAAKNNYGYGTIVAGLR